MKRIKKQADLLVSNKWPGWRYILPFALLLAIPLSATKPANAETQDLPPLDTESVSKGKPPLDSEPVSPDSVEADYQSSDSLGKQINNFVQDVRGFAEQGIQQIQQFIESVKGAVRVPDWGKMLDRIWGRSVADSPATQLENNLTDSYAVREDLANQAERMGAQDAAQQHTLSEEAQQRSQQIRTKSETAAAESGALAQDSEGQDTSQNILRNISGQLEKEARLDNMLLQEAQQARTDRALDLTLEAQSAKELSEQNTASRQTAIAEHNRAISQSGLVTMPGGSIYDNQTNDTERDRSLETE